jgi:hemerythrin-like domain-containing protein
MTRNILDELRAEHASMAMLLTTLERQMALFEGAERPDYGLVEEIISYFLDFPDQCHHPKEDMVAAKLLALAPEQAKSLNRLIAQHEEIAALTRRFAALFRQVLNEAELPRAVILRATIQFVTSQRHHMEMEDAHFLPLAEKLLSSDDIAELNSKLEARQDPLTHLSADQRYSRLRDTILAWDRADQSS